MAQVVPTGLSPCFEHSASVNKTGAYIFHLTSDAVVRLRLAATALAIVNRSVHPEHQYKDRDASKCGSKEGVVLPGGG